MNRMWSLNAKTWQINRRSAFNEKSQKLSIAIERCPVCHRVSMLVSWIQYFCAHFFYDIFHLMYVTRLEHIEHIEVLLIHGISEQKHFWSRCTLGENVWVCAGDFLMVVLIIHATRGWQEDKLEFNQLNEDKFFLPFGENYSQVVLSSSSHTLRPTGCNARGKILLFIHWSWFLSIFCRQKSLKIIKRKNFKHCSWFYEKNPTVKKFYWHAQ